MKKKLDTRFPAVRIKKIMQADEDVGKIAMAVPLLVSKALELHLQDLCDRTYEITLKRGAKIMSSSHLKQCVQSFNVFDFLREIVHRVPDLSASTAGADCQSIVKRRKLADHDDDGGGECIRSKMATGYTSSGGRGRGQGRGRGHGRGGQANEVDKFEDDPDMFDKTHDLPDEQAAESPEFKENALQSKDPEVAVRNFDLNMDLDEDGNAPSVSASGPEMPHNECSGCSCEFGKMGIDPIELASLKRLEDEDED